MTTLCMLWSVLRLLWAQAHAPAVGLSRLAPRPPGCCCLMIGLASRTALPPSLQGPKPAPQQAMTERQVADARAANAAVEAAEAAAAGSSSGAQQDAVPVVPRV